jgi:hypothetical protein
MQARDAQGISFGGERDTALGVGSLCGVEVQAVARAPRFDDDRRKFALGQNAVAQPVAKDGSGGTGVPEDIARVLQPASQPRTLAGIQPLGIFIGDEGLGEHQQRKDTGAVGRIGDECMMQPGDEIADPEPPLRRSGKCQPLPGT